MTDVPNLLDGAWTHGTGDRWLERRDPADGDVHTSRSPDMGPDDVDAAVAGARAAFPSWAGSDIRRRGDLLRRAAALLRAEAAEVAGDIVREAGLTAAEAAGEAERASELLEYYASFDGRAIGDVLPDRRPGVETRRRTEPIGTVVAVTPWNNPVLVLVRKLAPALIAGNTVLLKPAEYTPLSTFRVTRALVDAGLPAGVVNVVTGRGEVVGPLLAEADGIAGISFTGSTSVGHGLRVRGAARNLRVQAEMGGKNALYLAADGDAERAVEAIVFAGYGQCGQRCTATSRVVVARDRFEELVEALVTRTRELRVGPGSDPDSDLGPLVDAGSVERVLAAVARARDDGARVRIGGGRLDAGRLARGHFVAPTVITDALPSSALWQEEVFGPVVAVAAVDSDDEAIKVVNGTRYGLTASIYTRDGARARRFCAEVDAGNVAVNLPTVGWDVAVPFGGFRDSGSHYKEQGAEGLAFYTRTKVHAYHW